MPVIYANDVKTARMQAVADKIDDGEAAGTLVIFMQGETDPVALAVFTLNYPCGAAANGVLILDFDPDIATTGEADGTAAFATIFNADDDPCITGLTVTATGGGGDITLDNTSIKTGQTVTITAGTIIHAPNPS